MPDQEYTLPWRGPEEMGFHERWLAHLMFPSLRARYWTAGRVGMLSSREQSLIRHLLPRKEKLIDVSAEEAWSVLLAAEILRCAIHAPTPGDRLPPARAVADAGQAQDVADAGLADDTGSAD